MTFKNKQTFLRKATKSLNRGFTIVELGVVVVVIGILATVIVIGYNGITNGATEKSMQSDLDNAASQLALDYRDNSSYPSTAAEANKGQGLKTSGNNQLAYGLKPYGYCISVTNAKTTKTYTMKSITGKITEGNCNTTVSTEAGSGSYGTTNGPSATAQLSYPHGVAVASDGTIYFTDSWSHRIRKVTTSDTVETLAGSTYGFNDATGTAAQFYYPEGLDVDSAGNVYVADVANNRIRKITPSGSVSTLAGSSSGYVDATGAAARFRSPNDVAVDKDGNVFVADSSNHRIRKITPEGVVTTVAGSSSGYADGKGTAAQFYYPNGIAVDEYGVLYVSDSWNYKIRKITPEGVVTTLAGSTSGYLDGQGTAARFDMPWGISVGPARELYVADINNDRIRVVSPNGTVSTLMGTGTGGFQNGDGSVAQTDNPWDVVMDKNGVIYVADDTNRIRKVDY